MELEDNFLAGLLFATLPETDVVRGFCIANGRADPGHTATSLIGRGCGQGMAGQMESTKFLQISGSIQMHEEGLLTDGQLSMLSFQILKTQGYKLSFSGSQMTGHVSASKAKQTLIHLLYRAPIIIVIAIP